MGAMMDTKLPVAKVGQINRESGQNNCQITVKQSKEEFPLKRDKGGESYSFQ